VVSERHSNELDKQSSTLSDPAITGVVFKQLSTWPDERGFFRELIRSTDELFESGSFAQWSHSKMGEKTVKAWHFHHRQTDWWYCGIGVLETVLFDLREESPTFHKKMVFKLGETEMDSDCLCAVVKIPPGVAHGCKVLRSPSHLFYVTSSVYDSEDEGRLPFNSPDIPHSWGDESSLITSERDRRSHVPKYERVRLT
jgi:dTDP-4-dehydrorhamnose 3,5-epimerase